MRLIFMGTPSFAATILKSLQNNGHDIVAVYTQPDRPKGRGKKIVPPPVKRFAIEQKLEVYQPQDLSSDEINLQMASHKADAAIVAAYGKILPAPLLKTTRAGFINVHASLLPNYRGAAPIQWAIRNGDKVTGVSLMKMDSGMDTGDVYVAEQCDLSDTETTGTLFDKLADLSIKLLNDNLDDIVSGRLKAIPQDNSKASYAPMFNKEDERINWSMSGKDIVQLTRAYLPDTGTHSLINGKRLIFMSMTLSDMPTADGAIPGEIVAVSKKSIDVQSGQGVVSIERLKMPGKNEMSVRDFLNGRPMTVGMTFE